MMLIAGFQKALNNIRENRSVAVSGIVTTSISMIILGTVVLLYLNLIGLTQAVFQQANFSVFIGVDADTEVRDGIIRELKKIPNISNLQLVSAEEARRDLIASFGETGSVLETIELPPFPDIIEFSLDRRFALTQHEINKIRSINGVETVVSGRETKDQVDTFFTISEFVGVFLISLLIVAIVLMIHNAIQLAIRMRINEIELLKILGATTGFIQIPFVLEGIIIAILGYLISMGALYFLYTFVVAGITFNEATYGIADYTTFYTARQFLYSLLSIIALGFFSSFLATRKVLRELDVYQ